MKNSYKKLKHNRKEVPNTVHIFSRTVTGTKPMWKPSSDFTLGKMEDYNSLKIK